MVTDVKQILERLRNMPSYCLNRDEAKLRNDAADIIEMLARLIQDQEGTQTK